MGATVLERQLETYKKKIKIMEHALSASAGAYYNINITQNISTGILTVSKVVKKLFLFHTGKFFGLFPQFYWITTVAVDDFTFANHHAPTR